IPDGSDSKLAPFATCLFPFLWSIVREIRLWFGLFGFRAQQLLDDLFIFLLVALLEADLRVTNDAPGVHDVGRSAVSVKLAQIRAGTVKDRVSNTQVLGKLFDLLLAGEHGDGEYEEALLGVLFLELLEMDHLLARERSVAGEEAHRCFGMADFACVVMKGEPARSAGQ